MAIQTLNTAFQKDINQIVVSALKRLGPENELGLEKSFLGLLGGMGRIEFMSEAASKKAEKMIVPYAAAATAAYYDLDSSPQEPSNESVKTADIGFAYIRDTLKIRNFDNAALKAGVSHTGTSLYAHKAKEALKDLIAKMESRLVLGLGASNDPYGLDFWVNDSSVYGNIDQATDTWAQSTMINAGGAALSLKHLRQGVETVADSNGGKTSIIISSYRQRNKYRELIGSKISNTNLKLGDAEYSVVSYDGIPWIWIPGLTASVVYGLQMDSFKLKILLQNAPDQSLPQLENLDNAGLPFTFSYLGNVNDDQRYAITNYHQLVCHEPWKQFKIYGLATALS